jgi:hypothetical protein
MWFKHRAWIPVAWLLALANLGAVWFAARPGETWHATAHALLAGLFAVGAQRLTARQRSGAQLEQLQQALDQNDQLQQMVDGMQTRLVELEERVDFAERLLAKHGELDRLRAPPS